MMRRRQQDRQKATAKYTSNSRRVRVQYRLGCRLLSVPIHSTIAAAKAMMFRPRQHEMRPRSISRTMESIRDVHLLFPLPKLVEISEKWCLP
uniref:Putative ovule protein n=1 Tax=Solanum chacoense TaxID=4108 RepID=A0A0V0GQI3_SOLCH